MNIEQLYNEIAEDEGKILHVYKCSQGHRTVGIGHLILDDDPEASLECFGAYDEVSAEQSISEERCYELFQADVQEAVDEILMSSF